ncbi:MAG: squalene/phytoene synthase family protein [Magnetovibrio sp.]|nr:squalene/phytoene synthase family protein [Magnetovibrio sp.]
MTHTLHPEILAVCRQDRERYLSVLMAPPEHINALMALVAYNQELANAVTGVSEPMIGQIKLQWWIDAMPSILSGEPPSHPVAMALSQIGQGLEVSALQGLAEARNFDLEADRPQNLAQLVDYARATGGVLHGLMSDVLGGIPEERSTAHSVGTAWALIGLMRALPYHSDGRRDMLPQGVTVQEVLKEAQQHLDQARTVRVSKRVLSSVIIGRLATRHFKRLQRQNWDPAHAEEPPAGVGSVMSLWFGKLSGRF